MAYLYFSQEEEEEDMWDNYIYYLADTIGQTLRNNDTTLVNDFIEVSFIFKKRNTK
ncbi:MAG: hypothetical protein AAF573_07280 [Bacteroidota bacterium]